MKATSGLRSPEILQSVGFHHDDYPAVLLRVATNFRSLVSPPKASPRRWGVLFGDEKHTMLLFLLVSYVHKDMS